MPSGRTLQCPASWLCFSRLGFGVSGNDVGLDRATPPTCEPRKLWGFGQANRRLGSDYRRGTLILFWFLSASTASIARNGGNVRTDCPLAIAFRASVIFFRHKPPAHSCCLSQTSFVSFIPSTHCHEKPKQCTSNAGNSDGGDQTRPPEKTQDKRTQ